MGITFLKGNQRFPVGDCDPMLNLLAHAQWIELEIGSSCGGHGRCGGDRVKIPMDQQKHFSTLTEIEKRILNETQIQSGIRIACQVYPNVKDLVCEVEVLN